MQHSSIFPIVRRAILPCALLAACAVARGGHDLTQEDPLAPQIRPASAEGEQAIGHIRVPQGLRVELWAAEPMLANPVCMRVDNRDRVYLVETFRHTSNVLDIRGHMDWLTDDLACRTVADRVALLRRKYGPNVRTFTKDDDRVRLIEDTTGSGKADKATIYASGFNKIESGIAAGVLPFRGNVFLADIPSLYLLRDNKGDGVADYRQELSTGYGVHISFLGHDLHGLAIGPDRKLYFSIGDRGVNASAADGSSVFLPDTGGVFRCNLDGSKLELFASGLRNPQQLCFDDFGNLMTGDNNPDYGDPARWVYVVQGGDSGWRIGYQEATLPRGGGPWMWEKLYETAPKLKDAAYILPPVAHLGSGPSGVACYPGTGLSDKYNQHFFMVDFRGGAAHSVVHSFALNQKGASYEMVDQAQFIKGLLVTDIDFSARGGLYACDWTEGWNKPGKGRIYRVVDDQAQKDPIVAQTRQLLADGFEKRSDQELAALLSHRDRRVRLEAQFALVDRGPSAAGVLADVASRAQNPLARLHGIWGLGELGERTPAAYDKAVGLLADNEPEVRAQAAKVLGEGKVAAAYDGLVKLLADPQPRPRFFAAIALGRLGRKEAVAPLLALLKENDNQDAHLRHAAVMGLLGCNDVETLLKSADDASAAVRLGVLLTLRRLADPRIARFLGDSDADLVSEAAHAINDVPIPAAYAELAKLTEKPGLADPVALRAVNAAFRVGTPQSAAMLASFAGRSQGASDWIRVEALRDLGNWAAPLPLDRVMHMYWPLAPRDEAVARQAAGPAISAILHDAQSGASGHSVQVAAVALISTLKINDTAILLDLVHGDHFTPELRAEAVHALADANDPKLPEAVDVALGSRVPTLRLAGIAALGRMPGSSSRLRGYLENGSIKEQQAALAALGQSPDADAAALLSSALEQLLKGTWAPQTQLDLLNAAEAKKTPQLQAQLEKYEASLSKDDPLAEFRVSLLGGDARAGRAVFERSDASCIRCHTVSRQGGQVGPVLDGVGSRQNREYLLESIVYPNAKIAPGFETAVISLKSGKTVTGIVKTQTPEQVVLIDADNKHITINAGDIATRSRGVSAMPEGFAKTLSKRDLRDLVEYLASLKS